MAQQYKRLCLQKTSQSLILEEIRNMFDARISALESKMDFLISTCSTILNNTEIASSRLSENKSYLHDCCSNMLLKKLVHLEDFLRSMSLNGDVKNCKSCGKDNSASSKTVLLPSKSPSEVMPASDSNVQIITLNSEEDYPTGTWLGDEVNPQARVRVGIPPNLLFHINEHCTTPEKMALTLLDCLFPREVLAVSNLSGKGKHCKQQLDPLLIFGMRCHLKYKFNITENDWYRIKQNIDSKCRTIWRRKEKGLPLGGYKFNNMVPPSNQVTNDYDSSDENLRPVICFEISNESVPPQIDVTRDDDIQGSKQLAEDDFQELLPSGELFAVEESDCFTLQGHQLTIIPDHSIKEEDTIDGKQTVFLLNEKT